MTNSNGNNLQHHQCDDRLVAIPDLFWPQIQWAESDYARLQGRLDFYTDFRHWFS